MISKPLDIEWLTRDNLQKEITDLEIDWLFNKDSLTKRLTTLSEQQFSIDVLLGAWQCLRVDEYRKLEASSDKTGWVREVFLKGGGIPWVFARSVAMQTGLKNKHYDLINIGKKSLGSILFIDQFFSRSSLEVTCYPMELLPATHQFSKLWARRSSFFNEEIHVIVQEVFLPAFWQRLQEVTKDSDSSLVRNN